MRDKIEMIFAVLMMILLSIAHDITRLFIFLLFAIPFSFFDFKVFSEFMTRLSETIDKSYGAKTGEK